MSSGSHQRTITARTFRHLLISLCLGLYSLCGLSQVQTRYNSEQKSIYQTGDEVRLTILITTSPQTCLDGMKQIKLYQSGIEIKEQTEWAELQKGNWQKNIRLVVTGNKKGRGLLTIMRRTDKQSFTYQEYFNLTK